MPLKYIIICKSIFVLSSVMVDVVVVFVLVVVFVVVVVATAVFLFYFSCILFVVVPPIRHLSS